MRINFSHEKYIHHNASITLSTYVDFTWQLNSDQNRQTRLFPKEWETSDQLALWDQIISYTYHPNFATGIFTKNEETLEKTPQLVYLASLVSTS